ncbi:hypothetical protein K439DRAFT_1626329 [Ramaria rubella]|nr:hypothetical protein K439DRAFT_1626329 [Ramaria rubella]
MDGDPQNPMSLTPFPELPNQLTRYIMETAVRHLIFGVTAHSLVLVSKTVDDWITLLLYHMVLLDVTENGFFHNAQHAA